MEFEIKSFGRRDKVMPALNQQADAIMAKEGGTTRMREVLGLTVGAVTAAAIDTKDNAAMQVVISGNDSEEKTQLYVSLSVEHPQESQPPIPPAAAAAYAAAAAAKDLPAE